MKETGKEKPLSLAIPKGRLLERVLSHFAACGIDFRFEKRQLMTFDSGKRLQIYQVKNHDLPAYVHYGVTGLGIIGDDMVQESGLAFTRVMEMPFGSTKLCLCARKNRPELGTVMDVATSYVRLTRQCFHARGIPVKIIHLAGSVELAPIMGLCPWIVDLVETGNTLQANGLEVVEELMKIKVRLVANPAYFKIHFRRILELADKLGGGS